MYVGVETWKIDRWKKSLTSGTLPQLGKPASPSMPHNTWGALWPLGLTGRLCPMEESDRDPGQTLPQKPCTQPTIGPPPRGGSPFKPGERKKEQKDNRGVFVSPPCMTQELEDMHFKSLAGWYGHFTNKYRQAKTRSWWLCH